MQRFWLTFELFNKNGLMNHAAASAYGFLLSAAPALLFISFIASYFLTVSSEFVDSMLGQIEPLFGVFDVKHFIINFFNSGGSGISGIAGLISVITIFWTTRLCMLSIQRGLGVVFPGASSVLKNNIVTLVLGLAAMIIILITVIGLRAAIMLLNSIDSAPQSDIAPIINISIRFFFMFSLAILSMSAYRFFPAKHPKFKNIIYGALACIIFYQIFATGFTLLINPDRYDLIYGTLGRLFLFLMNIYFFFVFFFFGGQLINVLDFSDALLFIRLREVYSKGMPAKQVLDKLFATLTKPLKKYYEFYKKDETVFEIKSHGQEVYYVISGKAGAYLDNEYKNRISLINETNFFGEMASITSDQRAASIKAETDLEVLKLPPDIFKTILHLDPNIDQSLIKNLSIQLKSINQKIHSS